MGRNRIDIEYIEDDRKRAVTFGKRHKGLMKKAYELGVLTKADVAVIIINLKGEVFQYSSTDIPTILSKYTRRIEDDGDSLKVSLNPDNFRKQSLSHDPYHHLDHDHDGMTHLMSAGVLMTDDEPHLSKKHASVDGSSIAPPLSPHQITHTFPTLPTLGDSIPSLHDGMPPSLHDILPTVPSVHHHGVHSDVGLRSARHFGEPSHSDHHRHPLEHHLSHLDPSALETGPHSRSDSDDISGPPTMAFFTDSRVHE
eukprot:gnl/Carplike_NY0171/2484_a3338_527.p1 GENE.gnl/Carplike_NY0171/2484_a3338_527~~gnl/Carplike_NY0171/2484_a3338_527.p1  ORF type:complete len:254 (-),score=42.72 gnl/Carplike_NY0171/2484_a3338_527:97-858(-)